MAKKTWVNIAGTWRNVKAVWLNVNGTWTKVVPKGNLDGVWKELITYYEQFVAAGIGWNVNYTTLVKKFDLQGKELSIKDFGTVGHLTDMEVDPDGNLYVAIIDSLDIFDKSMELIRSHSRNFVTDVAVGKNRDYALIGQTGTTWYLEFWNREGVRTGRVVLPAASGGSVFRRGLCFDNNNDVIVHGDEGDLRKYDLLGNLIWRKTYVGSFSSDWGRIDVDTSNNIYRVCRGYIEKYNPNGDLITAKQVSTSTPPASGRGSIYVDKQEIFVTVWYSQTDQKPILAKFDKSLNRLSYVEDKLYETSVYADQSTGVYTYVKGYLNKHNKSDLSVIWSKRIQSSLEGGTCVCAPGRYGVFYREL
ncbi:hypothetical protein P4V39_00950 [Brevibacillus borstelensis]|jgi:hypothetical protein|uniref:hypothetical protein n=1 Tax=Brevibacillus borstelensis TaxID=45462 RepID=UPI002E222389|nr:hypothetical protein [Brevibacillus borstelensis]